MADYGNWCSIHGCDLNIAGLIDVYGLGLVATLLAVERHVSRLEE
jgi:hypothetical protein